MVSCPQIRTFSGSECSVGAENEGLFFCSTERFVPLITGESFAASPGQGLNVSISMNYVRPCSSAALWETYKENIVERYLEP